MNHISNINYSLHCFMTYFCKILKINQYQGKINGTILCCFKFLILIRPFVKKCIYLLFSAISKLIAVFEHNIRYNKSCSRNNFFYYNICVKCTVKICHFKIILHQFFFLNNLNDFVQFKISYFTSLCKFSHTKSSKDFY